MRGIFEELKRRNVFRVGVAYAVVGWLAVQVVNNFFPALNLPGWTHTFVAILILIGFPFALLFAWAYELTPEGLKRSHQVDPEASSAPSTGRKLDFVIIGALVLALGYFVWESRFTGTPETGEERVAGASIAVLPFIDLSPQGDQEYFSDGIAEELLNVLAQVPDLRVAARTSSFRFKEEARDIQDIARQLHVAHVLEGSVRKAGNQIRITAQLIDAGTGFRLWSASYDRKLDDIFAVQDEISHAIVDALKVALGSEGETMVAAATSNIEAYDIYLQGKFEFARRAQGRQAILNAVRLFEEAANLDPGFANAFAGLGRARAMLVSWHVATNTTDKIKQVRLARAATDRALTLDADNVEALLSSAIIRYQFEVDFEGAEADFERAVSLSPNDSEIYNFYGDFLTMLMDYDRAILMERRAAELDPLSIINAMEYGRVHVLAGRIDEGFGILESLAAAKPDEPFPARMLGRQYFRVGRIDDSLSRLEQAAVRWPADRSVEVQLLEVRAINGDAGALQELMSSHFTGNRIIFMASVFFEMGDFDQAAIWLDRAYQGGLNYYYFILVAIADPRRQVDHPGLNEIYSRPGLKELMDIRRRNLGLDTE